jgi:hypothetical protein
MENAELVAELTALMLIAFSTGQLNLGSTVVVRSRHGVSRRTVWTGTWGSRSVASKRAGTRTSRRLTMLAGLASACARSAVGRAGIVHARARLVMPHASTAIQANKTAP